MSRAVPHVSMEWLDDYMKRLGSSRNPPQEPATTSRKQTKKLVSYSHAKRVAVPLRAAEGKMSKTEERYRRDVLNGGGRFEPVSLRLPGGGRYTPDFMTIDDGVVTFHEVKGSYRLGSQGRAYTAFHEAAAYYPMWRFVWAHWTGKTWDVSTIAEDGDLTGS